MSNKLFYFAYGSNLSRKQMKERCPGSSPVAVAVLPNYELTFKGNKRGRGVADIIPCEGGKVFGALYELTFNDIKRLNRFEGHPYTYVKQIVTINILDKAYEAIVYIMNPEFATKAPDTDYLQKILSGYVDWNLPEIYLIRAAEKAKINGTIN